MRLVARLGSSLGLLILFARTSSATDPEATHITPPPQPPLVYISRDNFDDIRSAFNAATDRRRVIAMFSPT